MPAVMSITLIDGSLSCLCPTLVYVHHLKSLIQIPACTANPAASELYLTALGPRVCTDCLLGSIPIDPRQGDLQVKSK